MLQLLRMAVIAGWFFTAQSPHSSGAGAMVRTLIGPFSSEILCDKERLTTIAMFEFFEIEAQISRCSERQES